MTGTGGRDGPEGRVEGRRMPNISVSKKHEQKLESISFLQKNIRWNRIFGKIKLS
jgi:hypothetical protein